jgi:hypothetical protein
MPIRSLKKFSALLSILCCQACIAQQPSLEKATPAATTAPSLQPATSIPCEDLLEKWQKRPNKLEFSNCKYVKHPQFDRLVSTYVVPGKDAASIESFLRKQFQMSPLRFVCCGWEPGIIGTQTNIPKYGNYRDRDGYDCEITMTSEETVEKNWKKIPKFYVRVTKFLGSP